jgi:hypothetical protein
MWLQGTEKVCSDRSDYLYPFIQSFLNFLEKFLTRAILGSSYLLLHGDTGIPQNLVRARLFPICEARKAGVIWGTSGTDSSPTCLISHIKSGLELGSSQASCLTIRWALALPRATEGWGNTCPVSASMGSGRVLGTCSYPLRLFQGAGSPQVQPGGSGSLMLLSLWSQERDGSCG